MKKPELKEIALHIGNQEEAILFFNYYESQGWKVGKNPMKNWKSAASGWINRNKKRDIKYQSKVDLAIANTSTRIVDLLWVRMTEIYGQLWVNSYGSTPSRPWIDALNGMQPEKIATGLNQILKNGDTFPPGLPKFLLYCSSYKKVSQCALPGIKKTMALRENTKLTRQSEMNKIKSML